MNLSPESVKKTLLNKVNELSASSWQYTKKPTDFTRNRKISFSDVLLSTISMQKSASKTELLKYFDFNASAPTASALIQQRKKISPEAFDSLFYSFSNAFFLDKTLKGYDPIAVDGSDIYIPRNPKDPDTYRVTDRYNKGFNMIHLNAAYNLLSHLYTDVILQPLNHINEYIAMCDIIDHYTATNPTRKPLFIADRGFVSFNVFAHAIENNAWYGSKVWHSNDKYRKVIYQCNRKYKNGSQTCNTPHLTEDEIKTMFLKALNALVDAKGETIENLHGLIETVCQTEALDTEKEQLEKEMAIIAENLTNLIRENASVALNQEEQSGKEDKLRTLYGEKHDRFQKLETLIQEKNDKREILMNFISKLKDLTGEQTEFREELWGGLVDYIRVDSEKSSTVVFRGGIEIKTES